jgi:iron(III) transport system permease protein
LVPFTLGFIIPVTRLSLWSTSASKDFFNIELMQILFNSIGLASFSSVIIVIISIILLFSSKYFNSQIVKITNQFSVLGYSMPGAVIAMGILLVSAYINDITNIIITGTISSLFIAYLIRFLAVASQPIESGLEKECSQINQASRNLGKTAFQSLIKINLPLLKKPIFVGGILIFIDVFKELPLTLILRPFNFDTLATLTYDLNKQAQIFNASVPALFIIIVTMIPIIFLNKKLERKS